MTVLVDPLTIYPNAWGPFLAGSCHMVTDGNLEELHAFAQRIGLRRSWFQDPKRGKRLPHYDLTKGKRAQAVAAGAAEVSFRELFERIASAPWRKRPQKVAIVGSRDFPDLLGVVDYVRSLPAGTTVVSGGAPGVDRTAEDAADELGLPVISFKADWRTLGKKAGPVRNTAIVRECDRVVAFWDGSSRGTLDTISKARKAGKPVQVLRSRWEVMVAIARMGG